MRRNVGYVVVRQLRFTPRLNLSPFALPGSSKRSCGEIQVWTMSSLSQRTIGQEEMRSIWSQHLACCPAHAIARGPLFQKQGRAHPLRPQSIPAIRSRRGAIGGVCAEPLLRDGAPSVGIGENIRASSAHAAGISFALVLQPSAHLHSYPQRLPTHSRGHPAKSAAEGPMPSRRSHRR